MPASNYKSVIPAQIPVSNLSLNTSPESRLRYQSLILAQVPVPNFSLNTSPESRVKHQSPISDQIPAPKNNPLSQPKYHSLGLVSSTTVKRLP